MTIYVTDSQPVLASVSDEDVLAIVDASAVKNTLNQVAASVLREYMTSGLVTTTATTLAVTAAEHAGRTIALARAAGTEATLPAATGTGNVYKFVVAVKVSSVADIIQVANATDEFVGVIFQTDTDTSDNLVAYPAIDGDGFDTITMEGSTKGGLQGDHFTITDIAAGKFLLEGYVNSTGSVASPLSSDVS